MKEFNEAFEEFNEVFEETFWNFGTADKKEKKWKWIVATDGVLYRRIKSNIYWISIPGITTDKIDAKIEDSMLKISWSNIKYFDDSENTLSIPMVKDTTNVSMEVDNGLIIVTFETKPSNISINIK